MALKSITSRPSSLLPKEFKNCALSPVSVKASSSSNAPSTTVAQSPELKIKIVPTRPIEGQKTGTSDLRKKVKVFVQENYLANWIQKDQHDSLPSEVYKNGVLVLGGDGRYFNPGGCTIIIKIAAGNGVGKILVGNRGELANELCGKRLLLDEMHDLQFQTPEDRPHDIKVQKDVRKHYVEIFNLNKIIVDSKETRGSLIDLFPGRNLNGDTSWEAECESRGANKMIEYLRDLISKSKAGHKFGSCYTLQFADDFTYTQILLIDGSVVSKQGIRFVFTDGSRIIFRLSGTGSAGATVHIYI
ncbi:hypothetical protein OROMI_007338 [Orobanche minor]